ncbi:MAG: DUF502 domain-containing protein [Verrucomicrobiaceae bacterium]|nr:DUF502 domain-containing protein [Verrucomicrobiaceae bacterium]
MFFDPDFASPPKAEVHVPRGPVVWARNKFLTGLAVVTPLVITFFILQFVYTMLREWSQPVLGFAVTRINEMAGAQVIDVTSIGFLYFERFIGVLIPVLVLIALGVMATHVIGVRVMEAIDRLLMRIPFISFIYKSLKQVIDAFKGLGGKQGFKRVVYIDYPVPGMWMLGFVTGQYYDRIRKRNMTSVFLPCAPSPMTGMLVVVEAERVSDAPMTMEEAMKMIFSGGLVGPDNAPPRMEPQAAPTPVGDAGDLPPGLPTADDFEVSLAMGAQAESAEPPLQTEPPTKGLKSSVKGLFARKKKPADLTAVEQGGGV